MQRAKSMKTATTAPDPQEVADAIVTLVEAPAGTRPPRVVVDASNSPFTPRLNDTHAEVQRELFQAMGMGPLAD